MKAIIFSLFFVSTTFASTMRFDGAPCSEQQAAIEGAGFELNQCVDYYNGADPGVSREEYNSLFKICTCQHTRNSRSDFNCGENSSHPYRVLAGTTYYPDIDIEAYRKSLFEDEVEIKVNGQWQSVPGSASLARSLDPMKRYTNIDALRQIMDTEKRRYDDIDDCLEIMMSRASRQYTSASEAQHARDNFELVYRVKAFLEANNLGTSIERLADYDEIMEKLIPLEKALGPDDMSRYASYYPDQASFWSKIYCQCDSGSAGSKTLPVGEPGLVIDRDSETTLDLTKRLAVIEGDEDPTRTGDLSLNGGDQPGVDPTPAAGGDNGRIVINPDHYGQQSSLRFVDCHGEDVAGVKDGPAQGANWSAQLMNGNCWAVAFSNLLSISGGDGLQKTRISPTHLAAQVNLYQCFNVGEDYKLNCSQTESCNNLPDYDKNCLDENIGFKSQEPCSIMNNLKHDISVCPNQRENKSMVSEIGHLYYSSLSDLFRTYQEVKGDCDQCGNTFLVEQLGLNASPFEEVLACLETEDTYKNLVGIMCLYEKDCEGEEISLSKESAQGLLSCQNLSEVGDTNKGIENIQDSLDHGLPIGITFCYSKLVKKNRPCPILHSGVILGRSTYMDDGQRKQAFLLNPGFGTDLCQSLMNNEETDVNAISCDVDENGELTGNIWVTEEKLADQNLQNTWAISSTKLRDSDIYQQLTRDCPEQGDSDGESGSVTDPKKELDWLDDDGDFAGKVGPITGSATGGV